MPSIASSASVPGSPRPALLARLAPLLPVVAFLVYALATPGLSRGDSAGVYVTAAAIVEQRSFAIDGYIDALSPSATIGDASASAYPQVAYAAGRYYHAVPPGRALLAAPLYALGLLLAPLLGGEVPAIFVLLLGPFLGALLIGWAARQLSRRASPRVAVATTALVALLILPWAVAPSVPIVVAALAVIAGSAWEALLVERGGVRASLTLGLALGALVLVNYLVGGVACAFVILAAIVLLRRRAIGVAIVLLITAAIPLLALAAWQTAAFGLPWRLAFRFAVAPAARSLTALVRPESLFALAVATLLVLLLGLRPATSTASSSRRYALPLALGLVLAVGAIPGVIGSWRAIVLPVRWWEPVTLAPLLIGALILALVPLVWRRLPMLQSARVAFPSAVVVLLVVTPLVAGVPISASAATALPAENYAAPFAIETNGSVRSLWTFDRGKGTADPASLRLEAGARAVSPWIDVWPGASYPFQASGEGPLRVIYEWEDVARNSLTTQTAIFPAGASRRAHFAAPAMAAGLRLYVDAADGAATVAALRLDLAGGVRVEPFPNGQRAALAFSFDWESAMGGLIHSRSGEANGEGEGAAIGLRADGGPSVADAEEKGQRMRDGARFLADLFARYDIHATFYATGYDLLPGNPSCAKFLGDPVYANADAAHGWGSDWWRTHPWYGDDPCSTEAQAPAWYFASATQELAGEGHEIASHSFGHLYVRGVTPDQLAADLEEWNRAAVALGLPQATSFAFPWTSSNSLDERFWAVFARLGMTTLTRLYQTPTQPLPHPYELDRVKGEPSLLVFPDYYLASKADAQQEALARIDATLAVRGYHSLWDHPNEALEQGGQVIWSRVVDYAAAQRERGLWVAPVGEIAAFGTATRQLAVTALPIAGGTRLTVENRSGRALDAVTLHLPAAASAITADGRALPAGAQVVLPTLAPGGSIVVVTHR